MKWRQDVKDHLRQRDADSQRMAEARREDNPMAAIMAVMRLTAPRATRHPGSKRGAVHTPRVGGGNVHRAVTRPRRHSWNHLGKRPMPVGGLPPARHKSKPWPRRRGEEN